jgi:hypothetical protein
LRRWTGVHEVGDGGSATPTARLPTFLVASMQQGRASDRNPDGVLTYENQQKNGCVVKDFEDLVKKMN